MRSLLCVRISRFYSRILEQNDPALRDRAVVVHRDKRVLDANLVARTQGVRDGMKLPEAKALAEGGAFVGFREESYLDAQRDWLNLCAQFADGLEPISLHEALVDLTPHPNPRELAERLVFSVLGGRGGLGTCRWMAVAAASETDERSPFFDATVAPIEFAHRFPIAELPGLEDEQRARLEFLGFERLGELMGVNREDLRSQFGDFGDELRRMARGQGESRVTAVFPPHSVVKRMTFEGAVSDFQMLEGALARLAEELERELQDEDRTGKKIELLIEVADGAPIVRSRTFNRALQGFDSLLAALGLLARDLGEVSVLSLRVRMPETLRARRVQSAFGMYLDQRFRSEAVDSALSKVKATYGETAVKTGAEVTVPRRKQVLRAYQDGAGWV